MNTAPSEMQSSDRRHNHRHDSRSSGSCRSVWNPVNIGLMVLGFIFFAPIGFLILFGLVMGIAPLALPGKISEWIQTARDSGNWSADTWKTQGPAPKQTGNRVFDEFQQTQLDRIEEIREEVRHRDQHFKSFRDDEVRAADKHQFERFMDRRPSSDEAERSA